ncbi:hypothetical protein WJX77_005948 [Trebouxia sp. C0004]
MCSQSDEGGETPLEVSWWGPEDNHALLLYYHRDGVYLHRQNRVALQAWAQDLLEASNIRIDFTLRVEFKSSASYDMTCHPPKADKESKYELSEANITGHSGLRWGAAEGVQDFLGQAADRSSGGFDQPSCGSGVRQGASSTKEVQHAVHETPMEGSQQWWVA